MFIGFTDLYRLLNQLGTWGHLVYLLHPIQCSRDSGSTCRRPSAHDRCATDKTRCGKKSHGTFCGSFGMEVASWKCWIPQIKRLPWQNTW